jgi:hypothetical protein
VAAEPSAPVTPSGDESTEIPHRSPARYLWAMLLTRIYRAFPLTCPQCGTEMRIVAFITDASTVQQILDHIGEPALPPRIAPAREPPPWEEEDPGTIFLDDERFTGDPFAQSEPEYDFDQRLSW